MNNILLIFFADGAQEASSFQSSTTLGEALASSKDTISGREIKKYFYIRNSQIGSSIFQNYAYLTDDNELKIDHKNTLIDKYLVHIREVRGNLLENLDIQFMRAIEDKCEECQDHIAKIKRHLRTLPEIAEQHMESMEPQKAAKYNPFGNIYEIALVSGGSGYESAPEVHIEPPRGQYEGVQAKAIALLDGGKVAKIDIIDPGAGYTHRPSVKITPPGNGAPALAIAPPPANSFVATPPNENVVLED